MSATPRADAPTGAAARPTGAAARPTGAAARPSWRSVALPAEHGGWGLTLEPGVLGLLLAPSAAGAALAAAALVAFLARTPAKLVAVDLRRGRRLPRTRLAAAVAAVELSALVALLAVAATTAAPGWWVPLVAAGPLLAVEAWYDVRSRGRRLVPELAGSVGVASVAAAVALAGAAPAGLAVGAWLLLAARAVTSIPHVRDQIARLHGRPPAPAAGRTGDAAALVAALAAAIADPRLVPGAVAVAAIVAVQRLLARRPVPRPTVLGIRQLGLGVALVAVTSLGAAVL